MSNSREVIQNTIERLNRLKNADDKELERVPFIVLAAVPDEGGSTIENLQITVSGEKNRLVWMLTRVLVEEPAFLPLVEIAKAELKLEQVENLSNGMPSFEDFLSNLAMTADAGEA